jgi:cytochrome c-type biogenesis protein
MDIHSLVLIPLVFGLIGFVEPCSVGINIIFLNRINGFKRARRISETLIFTFVRGTFLGLAGLSAAFIGGRIFTIQSSVFVILGVIYVVLGGLAILNMYKPVFVYEINVSKYFKNRESVALGFLFGLIIPACGIAFVLALIGKSILLGKLLEGFISLFIFGIGLSFPLVMISFFDKCNEIVARLSNKARKIPWLAGVVLIVVGLLTMLSSSWWAGAAL